MRSYLVYGSALLGLLFVTNPIYAQKGKPNPFQQVAVPAPILKQLNNFIHNSDNGEEESPLYIRNILADKNFTYGNGIYYFRVMGSHSEGHTFIVNNQQATILAGHNTQELVQSFLEFLTKNSLSEENKVEYLKGFALFIENKYRSEHE